MRDTGEVADENQGQDRGLMCGDWEYGILGRKNASTLQVSSSRNKSIPDTFKNKTGSLANLKENSTSNETSTLLTNQAIKGKKVKPAPNGSTIESIRYKKVKCSLWGCQC